MIGVFELPSLPIPGPMLFLPNFHVDVVRMCSMHNVNLGLLFTANGSCLLRVQIEEILLFLLFGDFLLDKFA